MSKMFEVLGRLEEQSTTDVSPSAPKVNPPVPAPPFSLPTWSQRPTPNQLSRLPERPPIAPPANPFIAIAFDGSMVLIALCLFLGVCFAMGSATVLSLTRNIPWLASLFIGLTLLYWLLSAILNRETPGVHFARKRAAPFSGWPGVHGMDPRRQIDPPSGPPNRPQAANLLRRPLSEELALASKILTNEGVLDAYGSVSVRDERNPDRIFLTGTELGEYDLNGKLLNNLPGEGHPERFLHCEIYRARPDVVAIVHSRASELIPFGASSVPLMPISEMADFLIPGVPVFESRQVGQVGDALLRARALGQALAETLGDKAAVLMRGRGAVVVGPSLHVVVARAYFMNMNARLQAQSILLGGKVNYLETSESRTSTTASELERAWEFWKQKLPK